MFGPTNEVYCTPIENNKEVKHSKCITRVQNLTYLHSFFLMLLHEAFLYIKITRVV